MKNNIYLVTTALILSICALNNEAFARSSVHHSTNVASNSNIAQSQPPAAESNTMWDKTKEVSSDVWDGTKKVGSDVWDGTKKVSSDLWDGTKKVGGDVSDAVSGSDSAATPASTPSAE